MIAFALRCTTVMAPWIALWVTQFGIHLFGILCSVRATMKEALV